MKRSLVAVLASACGSSPAPRPVVAPPPPPPTAEATAARSIPLPGGGPDGIGMDYLLFEPTTQTVWAPAGGTGAVDVIDAKTLAVKQVTGFATKEVERRGKKRVVGPSSAALGKDVVYVGSRGDNSICAVDVKTLTKGACGILDAMPDAIAYIPMTNEIWATTPREKSIQILDGTTLKVKAGITFAGQPEGLAIDNTRMRVYTNLEDTDKTISIDMHTHKLVAEWLPACGEEGPHGLRLADAEGLLFVACDTKVEALDLAKDGAIVGTAPGGGGVDDFDYSPARHALYVGGARSGTLAVISVGANGVLTPVSSVPTAPGARNGVVVGDGRVFLAHGAKSELLVVPTR